MITNKSNCYKWLQIILMLVAKKYFVFVRTVIFICGDSFFICEDSFFYSHVKSFYKSILKSSLHLLEKFFIKVFQSESVLVRKFFLTKVS